MDTIPPDPFGTLKVARGINETPKMGSCALLDEVSAHRAKCPDKHNTIYLGTHE